MFAGMPDFNQSLEMMKTMWDSMGANAQGGPLGGANLAGAGTSNPFGLPTMDVEELDKRIAELKSVESWLTLNLNVLKTTIQGLEVQRATLGALNAFADSVKGAAESGTKSAKGNKNKATDDSDPMASAGNMGNVAMDMMNNMAQAMTEAMSGIPGVDAMTPTGAKATGKKKATASKSGTPRRRQAASKGGRRAKGS